MIVVGENVCGQRSVRETHAHAAAVNSETTRHLANVIISTTDSIREVISQNFGKQASERTPSKIGVEKLKNEMVLLIRYCLVQDPWIRARLIQFRLSFNASYSVI